MRQPVYWINESIPRWTDTETGAYIYQLTSAPAYSFNVYCEQPYVSSEGGRIAFVRSMSFMAWHKTAPGRPSEVWVGDLESRRIAPVDEALGGWGSSAYKDHFYYIKPDGDQLCLSRVNLLTVQKEDLFRFPADPRIRLSLSTVSPDGRYFVGGLRLGPSLFGLYRIDTENKTFEVFHEQEDIFNHHVQFEPTRGNWIMVQHNRGGIMDEDGNVTHPKGKSGGYAGATLYFIDGDGCNLVRPPVGEPYTTGITGHEAWIGDTESVVLTVHRPETGGNILQLKPGGEPRVITEEYYCGHISASADGKYFIGDTHPEEYIVVGSIETGRSRPLCTSHTERGAPQPTHAHPYMTTDNRHVIFNSNHTGNPQVHVATLPEGFLESVQ